MASVSLHRPGSAVLVLALVVAGVCAVLVWRYTERLIWPSLRVEDIAYQASEKCVTEVLSRKDSLLFAGLGLDPGAIAHLRSDGNYESSGWVEQMNEYGHRDHRIWRCVLHRDGSNNWTLVYLRIGNHVEGIDPK
jgi:hypothetical protein